MATEVFNLGNIKGATGATGPAGGSLKVGSASIVPNGTVVITSTAGSDEGMYLMRILHGQSYSVKVSLFYVHPTAPQNMRIIAEITEVNLYSISSLGINSAGNWEFSITGNGPNSGGSADLYKLC